jgi:hypothetical protein
MAQYPNRPRAHSTTPRRRPHYREMWDAQREVALLTAQLASERSALETWQRRLELRTEYEKVYNGITHLPVLRQATAACNLRVIELERRLAEAQHELRVLRAEVGSDVKPWTTLR